MENYIRLLCLCNKIKSAVSVFLSRAVHWIVPKINRPRRIEKEGKYRCKKLNKAVQCQWNTSKWNKISRSKKRPTKGYKPASCCCCSVPAITAIIVFSTHRCWCRRTHKRNPWNFVGSNTHAANILRRPQSTTLLVLLLPSNDEWFWSIEVPRQIGFCGLRQRNRNKVISVQLKWFYSHSSEQNEALMRIRVKKCFRSFRLGCGR